MTSSEQGVADIRRQFVLGTKDSWLAIVRSTGESGIDQKGKTGGREKVGGRGGGGHRKRGERANV